MCYELNHQNKKREVGALKKTDNYYETISKTIILSRLGWTQEKIAEITGMTQGSVAQIINNANFCEINNLLSHGHDMEYIARHYQMDLAL